MLLIPLNDSILFYFIFYPVGTKFSLYLKSNDVTRLCLCIDFLCHFLLVHSVSCSYLDFNLILFQEFKKIYVFQFLLLFFQLPSLGSSTMHFGALFDCFIIGEDIQTYRYIVHYPFLCFFHSILFDFLIFIPIFFFFYCVLFKVCSLLRSLSNSIFIFVTFFLFHLFPEFCTFLFHLLFYLHLFAKFSISFAFAPSS